MRYAQNKHSQVKLNSKPVAKILFVGKKMSYSERTKKKINLNLFDWIVNRVRHVLLTLMR